MGEIVTELYVEIYYRLFRIFRNENIAAAIDLLLLTVFQAVNIYSLTVIIQKFLSIDLVDYFLHQRLFIAAFLAILFVINFLVGKSAHKLLKKENAEMLISRRFFTYVILSIVLFLIARFALKP